MSGLADIRGKVAVVTGGASGIGRGLAEALLDAGARVVLADIEPGVLDRTARELDVPSLVTDVRDFSALQALADFAGDRYGGVDILCNNAGVGPAGALADLTREDWQWIIDVNLWGVINGLLAFLPKLRANPSGGHIVNTASMSGLASVKGLGAYSVTKFGVVALSESLAAELADEGSQVGVTVLCPGPVRSEIGRSLRNQPTGTEGGPLRDFVVGPGGSAGANTIRWLDPRDVGAMTVEAIRTGRLYLLTHPELFGRVETRYAALAASAAVPVSGLGGGALPGFRDVG